MKKTLLAALFAAPLVSFTLPTLAAESEAMQRERALNRILVTERQERERDAAARGNGLIAMSATPVAAKEAADKPKEKADKARKKAAKAAKPAKKAG